MTPSKEAGYNERLKELIQDGSLVKFGVDKIYKKLKSEFPVAFGKMSKKRFLTIVEKLIWDSATEDALRRTVRLQKPLEQFSKVHTYVPKELLDRKARSLKGLSRIDYTAPFLRGMGRIGDISSFDSSYELPQSSLSNPYLLCQGKKNPQFCIINGANIGLKYSGVIEENPIRLALAYARKTEQDAVIMINPFNIDSRKAAGGLRVQRAFASGLKANLNRLDPFYKNYLGKTKDDIIYETIAERFVGILSGLIKIVKIPNGTLEFSGPILVVFGYIEEQFIATAAAWELGYKTRLKQDEVETEIRISRAMLRKCDSWEDKVDLENEIEKLVELKARIIQSNISDETLRAYAHKATNFVVDKIQRSLPNVKIIGQGTTHIKVGDNPVELYVPNHLRVSDGLLDAYNKSFGARAIRAGASKTTFICHPYALGFRTTSREINEGNKRAEAKVYVAPTLVDGQFLREILRDRVRGSHPISSAIFNSQFTPGILRVRFDNGICSADSVPIQCLSKVKTINSGPKYIWTMVATDPHFGSRMREEVWSDSAKGSLGVSDAVIQMFRDAKLLNNGSLPIHLYTVNDDPTQGNHFDTHKQPHVRQMSYQNIEKHIQNLSAKEAKQFALEQFRIRGSDWLQEQMQQVLERHINPNLDFFNSILQRVLRSKIFIKGVSKIHGTVHDSRDLGAINWGTGNHFESTVDRVMTEGIMYAMNLRAWMKGSEKWRGKEDLIDRLVAAPLEGNQYFAWGTVQAPGGYEWGIEFRSDPPRLCSWADPLLAVPRNDASRGDYSLFMTGRKTLKIYGDKHFNAAVNTESTYYHMGAPGVSTDLYGHRGFPPNNTGISFVGLPTDGPESGPILLRSMHIQDIVKYFKKPYRFDWENFLPNPV